MSLKISQYWRGYFTRINSTLKSPDPLYSTIAKVPLAVVWLVACFVFVGLWIIVGFLVDYQHSGEAYLSIRSTAEFVNGVSVWLVFVPTIWVYYRWLPSRLVGIITRLEKNEVLAEGKAGAGQKCLLSDQLNRAFFSSWIQLLAMVATAVSYTILMYVAVPIQNQKLALVDFWYYTPAAKAVFSALYLIANYVLFTFAFRAIAMVILLQRYFSQVGVIKYIYPLHPDGSGGLGGLGQLSIRLGLFAVLVATWATIYALYPTFSGGQPQWAMTILIYIIYIFIAPFVVILPMWQPHLAMLKYKNDKLETLSKELLALDEDCFYNINGDNNEALSKNLARIKELQELDQAIQTQFPVWPISFQAIKRFGAIATSPFFIGFITLAFEYAKDLVIPR